MLKLRNYFSDIDGNSSFFSFLLYIIWSARIILSMYGQGSFSKELSFMFYFSLSSFSVSKVSSGLKSDIKPLLSSLLQHYGTMTNPSGGGGSFTAVPGFASTLLDESLMEPDTQAKNFAISPADSVFIISTLSVTCFR